MPFFLHYTWRQIDDTTETDKAKVVAKAAKLMDTKLYGCGPKRFRVQWPAVQWRFKLLGRFWRTYPNPDDRLNMLVQEILSEW